MIMKNKCTTENINFMYYSFYRSPIHTFVTKFQAAWLASVCLTETEKKYLTVTGSTKAYFKSHELF